MHNQSTCTTLVHFVNKSMPVFRTFCVLISMHSDLQSCLEYTLCTRVICKYVCTWLPLASQGEYVAKPSTYCTGYTLLFLHYYALMLLYIFMVIYGLTWPDPSSHRVAITCSISTYTASNNAPRICLRETS